MLTGPSRWGAMLALMGVCACVQAQDYQYSVLVDLDRRADTGCSVDLGGGNVVDGIERRLDAFVSADTQQVVSLTVQTCSGGGFSAASGVGGGYPVGLNNGFGGADVIELGASLSQLTGASHPRPFHLHFAAQSASGSDVLGSRDGAGGVPISFGLPPLPVPVLGLTGLLVLALILVVLLRTRRFRHLLPRSLVVAVVLGSGLVLAANFVLDGEVGDWAGSSPAATDAIGDSTSGQAAIDIVAGYAAHENGHLFFRIDVLDIENNAPITDPIEVETLEDQAVTIVLSALDDPGKTLSFAIASPPTNGTLGPITTIDATSAEVEYTPAPDYNGNDGFTFTANDGELTSAPAPVNITIVPVNDAPSFTAQNATLYENGGAQTAVVATDISAGPPDEAGQALTFDIIDNTNPGLFALAPTISPDGVLSATPAADQLGSATLTVVLRDDGGTDNGGIDSSDPQTLIVTVDDVNDPPSFTPGPDVTVLEDAGAQSLPAWATDIDDGDTGTQGLAFIVEANSNPGLFAVAPAIDATTGTLTFTSADDAFGSADITIVLRDDGGTDFGGNDTSPPHTFSITVTPVNDAPSFTAVDPPAVFQDSGPAEVAAWATFSPGPGNESGQVALEYQISAISNAALFSAAPTVEAATGTLRYTPAVGARGTSQFTVRVRDDGGTADGGIDLSDPQTFTITVTGINNAPSFTPGPDVTVLEDAGPQSIAAWATDIDDGDEGTQMLTFIVQNNSNPDLFSAAPAIDASTGTLSFTTAEDANGSASITIVLQDDGGTDNGGNDTSAPSTFSINVTAVNDAPSFVLTDPPASLEDAGAQSVTVATAISPGPPDEAGQAVNFVVTLIANDATLSFAAAPAISASGVLTFTAAPDAWGTASFEVVLQDDGGTANGGVDTSPPQTLTIVVTGVNDAPSFTAVDPPSSLEDAGPQTVAGWVTGFDPGPNEPGQAVAEYLISAVTDPALFSAEPTVSVDGTLSYTAAPDAFGTSQFTVRVRDDGGTANGGVDLSAPQTFTITVEPVNDPPIIDLNGPAPGIDFAASFIEAGGPVAIVDPVELTVLDIDSTELVQAVVRITNLFDADDELLTVDLTGSGLSALYFNGELTLTGNAAPSVYQTVLRTTTYDNLSTNPDETTRQIEFVVEDDDGDVNVPPAVSSVSVLGVNSPPSFTPGADPSVLEDSGAYDQPWATDLDDGDDGSQTLTFIIQNNSNPTLFSAAPAISGTTGNLSFTPAPDANGTAEITIVLQDNGGTANGGSDTSPPATFTITVIAVNDPPSFTLVPPPASLEDAGPQSVTIATDISAGPPDEVGQVLSFNLAQTSIAPTLSFSQAPSVAADGTLSYTAAPNAWGTAQFDLSLSDDGGTANGGNDTSPVQSFTLTVTLVNNAPSFTPGADPTVLEDSGPYDQPWASDLDDGDGGIQVLSFVVTNNTNPGLFSAAPAISGTTGNLAFTPAPDANGTADITIVLQDDGGTDNGGVDSSGPHTFTITVTAVNDPPSFTLVPPPASLEDAGPQSVVIASDISAGPPDEVGQVLSFNLAQTSIAPTLSFSQAPSVAADGTLSYTAAPNAWGTAQFDLSLSDDGGTANGGNDTSPVQSFTLTVTLVNDAPSFTPGADPTVLEDSGPYDQPWASDLDDGDGGVQVLSFVVTNNTNPGLFSAAPAISGTTGNLAFTPAPDANGTADITIVLQDDGGTDNGGVDTSGPHTFTITVTAVNDAPSFTIPASAPDIFENDGAQTVPAFATDISAGPPDEAGQGLTFNVNVQSATGNLSFGQAPAIDPLTGTLTYTPNANTSGVATVEVTLSDDGGTANGGQDTSPPQVFTIAVLFVNSPPTFTPGGAVTVLEDSGAYSAAWATDMDDGDPTQTQALTFIVQNNTNSGLFSVQPAIDAVTGVLTFTPGDDEFGSADITIVLQDDGGTDNGGDDTSAPVTFTINVTGVNDPPYFDLPGAAPDSHEDAGAQTVPGFATNMSTGPANESGQTLIGFTVVVDGTDPTLNFSAAPAIALDGTLTYTAAPDAFGTATLTATLQDDGGTADGGVDVFSRSFTITVIGVNDAPSFTPGGNVNALEDAGPQNLAWATDLDDGDGGTQVLTFIVTNNTNAALFSAQPAVSGVTGNLSFTSAPDAYGVADITLVLQDNGGTANGGVDTSAPVTFTITVDPVNDPPVVVPPTNVAVHRHIGIVIPAVHSANLLANVTDVDGPGAEPFTLTTVTDAATANGGRVTTFANGSWNYAPPASNTLAVDSFDYQVCDSGVPLPPACTNATATIALSGPAIWFVHATAAPGGDGTHARPFQTLAAAAAAAGINGRIFKHSGSHTGGATLLDGQQLIGQGATGASFDALFGITPPAHAVARPAINGARPLVTTAGGSVHGITLGSGNTVRGIEIGNTSGTGLHGTSVGTLSLGENRISGAGQALNLVNGTITQVGPGNAFDQIDSTGGTSNIALNAIAGTANLGTGVLSGASGTAFAFIAGTANVTYAGTITKTTAGRLIDIDGAGAATVTLSGNLSCTGSCGSGATHAGIRVNARTGTGTYVFSGATKTISSSGANHGVSLTGNSAGSAIRFDNGGLAVTTTSGTAFHAVGGGAVSVSTGTNPNTLIASSGIGLNFVNTTIAAADLTFRSISASGSSSGIVLNNTGTVGSLFVTGNGGPCVSAVSCTGGAIQNMSSHGIWLQGTTEPTLTNVFVNNTGHHGVGGTEVNGFSFTNSVVSNSGTSLVPNRANIGFNVTAAGTERNLYGTVTITGNTLTNSQYQGIEIFNYNGTIDAAEISNNTLTSSTLAASSQGPAISLIAYGSAATVAHVTRANINNNVVSNFPGGVGIQAQGGNSTLAGTPGTFGVPGHATNIINITGNRVAGASPANRMGAEAIVTSVGGRGQGNFNISNNGTVTNPITNVTGSGIGASAFGNAVVTATINNNVIVANNSFGSQGIGGGLAPTFGTGDTPEMTVTVSNNTISQTDGNGILLVARDTNGTLRARVLNNTVAAPLSAVRPGIRIDSGNSPNGDNDTVCLNIAGNTSAGSGGHEGIGLRKQGTDPNVFRFGIHGMAATASPGVEAYVNGLNPAGNGTLLISAGSGFSNCNLP